MTIEISCFKLTPGVTAEEFQSVAREATCHLKQFVGFRSRKLFHDPETGQWTDILHWDGREQALRASRRVPEMDELQPFIQQVDPSAVEMYHGDEVRLEA